MPKPSDVCLDSIVESVILSEEVAFSSTTCLSNTLIKSIVGRSLRLSEGLAVTASCLYFSENVIYTYQDIREIFRDLSGNLIKNWWRSLK